MFKVLLQHNLAVNNFPAAHYTNDTLYIYITHIWNKTEILDEELNQFKIRGYYYYASLM